jgi:DNA-binding MltR family transcriptional regulator
MADKKKPWEKVMDEVFFNAESGHAILRAAVLDQLLLKLLLTHMPPMSNTFAEEVFDGPLSTFSAKIDVCRALGLIDADTHRDLRAIKAVRNAFAHAEETVHFESPHIVKEVKKFKDWKQGADARKLFDAAATWTAAAIRAKTDALIFAHAMSKEDGG